MEPKRAKEILMQYPLRSFNNQHLRDFDGEVRANTEERTVLRGYFTADELEAIAAWMRDPTGVTNA